VVSASPPFGCDVWVVWEVVVSASSPFGCDVCVCERESHGPKLPRDPDLMPRKSLFSSKHRLPSLLASMKHDSDPRETHISVIPSHDPASAFCTNSAAFALILICSANSCPLLPIFPHVFLNIPTVFSLSCPLSNSSN
jgi:hypothetical protein